MGECICQKKKNISNYNSNNLNKNNIIQGKPENLTGYSPAPESIMKKMFNSIVNIRFINSQSEKIYATGFFMCILIKKQKQYYLFTCKHVISEEDINNKKIINLYYGEKNNEESIKIELDRNIRNIITFKIDITIIEIIKKDNILEDKYLIPDGSYEYGYDRYINKDCYLAGYPGNYSERCASVGKIIKRNDYTFSHKLPTFGGSSGSPICNNNCDVIGIHTSSGKVNMKEEDNINYGIFIGEIIKCLKGENISNINNNKNYIIGTIYISNENINKDINIINSYEHSIIYNGYKCKNENENEIKENCIIKINNQIITFNYFYKFKFSGNYTIEYSFKNNLTNTCYMFAGCSSLTNLNLSNFNTQNVKDMQ